MSAPPRAPSPSGPVPASAAPPSYTGWSRTCSRCPKHVCENFKSVSWKYAQQWGCGAHADLPDEQRLVGGGVAHVHPDGLAARTLLLGAIQVILQNADRVRVAEDLVLARLRWAQARKWKMARLSRIVRYTCKQSRIAVLRSLVDSSAWVSSFRFGSRGHRRSGPEEKALSRLRCYLDNTQKQSRLSLLLGLKLRRSRQCHLCKFELVIRTSWEEVSVSKRPISCRTSPYSTLDSAVRSRNASKQRHRSQRAIRQFLWAISRVISTFRLHSKRNRSTSIDEYVVTYSTYVYCTVVQYISILHEYSPINRSFVITFDIAFLGCFFHRSSSLSIVLLSEVKSHWRLPNNAKTILDQRMPQMAVTTRIIQS